MFLPDINAIISHTGQNIKAARSLTLFHLLLVGQVGVHSHQMWGSRLGKGTTTGSRCSEGKD